MCFLVIMIYYTGIRTTPLVQFENSGVSVKSVKGIKKFSEAGETAQCIKMLIAKGKNLNPNVQNPH